MNIELRINGVYAVIQDAIEVLTENRELARLVLDNIWYASKEEDGVDTRELLIENGVVNETVLDISDLIFSAMQYSISVINGEEPGYNPKECVTKLNKFDIGAIDRAKIDTLMRTAMLIADSKEDLTPQQAWKNVISRN